MHQNCDSTSKIKAIETEYKGYRFRSRLEARWAVFFESFGIEWKYEPEGFVCDRYANTPPIQYLPDFYLPKSNTWVEVKGSNDGLRNDAHKLGEILDWDSPIPGIHESYGTNRGLIVLGDIPEPIWGITLHPIIQHHKGLLWSWCRFSNPSSNVHVYDQYEDVLGYFIKGGPTEWCIDHKSIETPLAIEKLYNAYLKARQARFEHGAQQ